MQKCKNYATIVQTLCNNTKTIKKYANIMQTCKNYADITQQYNIYATNVQTLSKHCAVNDVRGSHDNTSKFCKVLLSPHHTCTPLVKSRSGNNGKSDSLLRRFTFDEIYFQRNLFSILNQSMS